MADWVREWYRIPRPGDENRQKVYEALVKGHRKVPEIVRYTGLSRATVYRHLNYFEKKGFVERGPRRGERRLLDRVERFRLFPETHLKEALENSFLILVECVEDVLKLREVEERREAMKELLRHGLHTLFTAVCMALLDASEVWPMEERWDWLKKVMGGIVARYATAVASLVDMSRDRLYRMLVEVEREEFSEAVRSLRRFCDMVGDV